MPAPMTVRSPVTAIAKEAIAPSTSPISSARAVPIAWLAQRGILAAPGDFYGTSGASHVRVALTATDERIASAAARLGEQPQSN